MFARDFSVAVREKKAVQPSYAWRSSRAEEKNVLVWFLRSRKTSSPFADSIQSKTVNYTVKHISVLPDNVHGDRVGQAGMFLIPLFRGLELTLLDHFPASILSSSTSSYAVAVTSDHVFIWDYTTPVASPHNLRLALPVRCKSTEPHPLAAVVASGSSTEVGLLLVYPSSGKVFYWENIDSIQALSLSQQRKQLVEGSVTGLLSRDTIDQLIDAESAGYLLLFSSGKLAHLTIRDAQGRPQISISSLNPSASTSWLGGWTHALGRGWRERISSIKTRPSATKGQVEVIGLNGDGVLKTWEISWAGNSNFIAEYNAFEEIRAALIRSHALGDEARHDFKTLDFVLLTESHASQQALITLASARGMQVLVLVGIQTATAMRYALVEVNISSNAVRMTRVLPIAFETANSNIYDVQPRLLLPKPEHTVFIVLEDQVFVISLDEQQQEVNSPDDQLRAESFGPDMPFQDVIYFRKDKGATIETAAVEKLSHHHKHEQASIVLLTKATGIVRIIATDPMLRIQSPERFQVTPKSKLEQAVFYGSDPENILDFSNVSATSFSIGEVEEAVLDLSKEIIDTKTRYLPGLGPSMDAHLDIRAKALRDLMTFLRAHYPMISRRLRWQLFWDAEKVSAARGMWQAYEKQMQTKEQGVSSLFLDHLMLALHEKYKEPLRPEVGQLDPVRQWFAKDVSRLDRILSNSSHVLTEPMQKGVGNMSHFMRWMIECEELWFAAYESVYSFRENPSNLELYGLINEDLQNGILRSGYAGLDEFWTARSTNVNAIRMCTRYFRKTVLSIQKSGKEANQEKAQQIASYQPRLVSICCLIHTERYRWLLEQDDDQSKASGEAVKKDYETSIAHEEIAGLASLGEAEAGMKLAEELHEIPALVDLILDELVFSADSHDDPTATPVGQANTKRRISILEERVQRYFRTFGDEFASAFYAAQIRDRHLGDLLSKTYGRPGQLTTFLRSDPSRAKFSWINDVINEKEMGRAAQALSTAATNQEHNIWSKKIELSLAKLALLSEHPPESTPLMTARRKSITLNKQNRELLAQNRRDATILDIQEQLYRHVRPIIVTALDDAGASDAIMTTYGEHLKDRPQLQELLRRGFEQLLKHEAMAPTTLIDVLSLMGHVHSESAPDDIANREYLLALTVLDASSLRDSLGQPGGEGYVMARLIWKRLFVSDNWKEINNTIGKSDSQVEGVLTDTALFKTFKLGESQCQFNPHHFSKAHAANSHSAIFNSGNPVYAILHPSDVLKAGSSQSDLSHRFSEADLLSGFVKDNSKDDKTLQSYINSARLEYWIEAVRKLAVKKVEEDAEAAAEEAEAFREFQMEYQAPVIENPEEDDEEEEEEEAVLNGVEEEYGEGDDPTYVDEGVYQDEEQEHMMHGGRGYSVDEDVEMEE